MVYSQTTVWCELIGFHSSKSYCWSSPSQVVIFFYTLWKPLVSQSCTTWQKNRYYRTRSVPPCKSPVITVFQLYVAMQWYLLARWRRSSRGPLALSHAVEVIRSPSLQYCTVPQSYSTVQYVEYSIVAVLIRQWYEGTRTTCGSTALDQWGSSFKRTRAKSSRLWWACRLPRFSPWSNFSIAPARRPPRFLRRGEGY